MVLRAFFYTSTFALDEFVGYEVAALTMLGLGHALNTGSLIRVNLLTRLLPPRGQRWMELASVAIALILCAYLCRYHLLAIETAYVRGARSNTLAAIVLDADGGVRRRPGRLHDPASRIRSAPARRWRPDPRQPRKRLTDMGMEAVFTALAVLGLMLAYLAMGIWIFAALLLVAITSLYFLAGFSLDRVGFIMQSVTWSAATRWELSAIPMFVSVRAN